MTDPRPHNWQRACSATSTCVEVGHDGKHVHVRDSKHPNGPILTFDEDEWDAFIAGVKAGTFDWTTDTEEQQ